MDNVCKLADFGSAKKVIQARARLSRVGNGQSADILNTAATGTPLWFFLYFSFLSPFSNR